MPRSRILIVRFGTAALAALLLFVLRAPLLRAAVAGLLDAATGWRVAFDDLTVGRDRIVAQGLRAERDGTFARARRATLRIAWRDVGFGAARDYGIRAVDLDAPVLQLHAKPSLPAARTEGTRAEPAGPRPLDLDVRVRNGRIELDDAGRALPRSRHLVLAGIDADLQRQNGRTRYTATARLEQAADLPPAALVASGTLDPARGYAVQHLQAERIPLRDGLNYLINYAPAALEGGTLEHVRLTAYAFGGATHVGASGRLRDGRLMIPGLRVPARGLGGPILIGDQGVTSPRLTGSLAGMPVVVAGGVYNYHDPELRLGITARGGLDQARHLFRFSQHLPLGGRVAVRALVEGPVGDPLVVARVDVPAATYGRIPLQAGAATVYYAQSALALAPAEASWGAVRTRTLGTIDLAEQAHSRLFVDAAAPAARVPYAAQVVPAAALRVSGIVEGDDLALGARGVAGGDGKGQHLAGLFSIDRHGDGEFGPLRAERDGGTVAASFILQRSRQRSGFWLAASHYPLAAASARPALAGLPGFAPPDISGTFDAALAGAGPPDRFRLAGRFAGRDVRTGGLALDRLAADVSGAPQDLALANVDARGSLGSFSGRGNYDGRTLALGGRYAGRAESLRGFTGDLAARGPLAGGLAVSVGRDGTVIQAGQSGGAVRVRNLPVAEVAGTLGMSGGVLRLYAGSARLAGGRLAAAGELGRGDVGLSVAGVRAGDLRGIGLPLRSGSGAAIGRATSPGGRPQFDGGAVLDGAYGRYAFRAAGDLTLGAAAARLRDGGLLVDRSYARLGGRLEGLGSGTPRYDVAIDVRDAALEPFARSLAPQGPPVAGTLDAQLTLGGSGTHPRLSGPVQLPEAVVSGLSVRDGRGRLALSNDGFGLSAASLRVGSSVAAGSLVARRDERALTLRAHGLDLADFDDLFDEGDSLAGRGNVDLALQAHGTQLRTRGQVALAGLRYRRYALGDGNALWNSRGQRADLRVSLGGPAGRMAALGTVAFAGTASPRSLLRTSTLEGRLALRDLDVATWLPLLGYGNVPASGRLDADARAHGAGAGLTVDTSGTLREGRLWRVPVSRFDFAARTANGRTDVALARLDLPGLSLAASGYLGLRPDDPLRLVAHARSSDVGLLATTLLGPTGYPSRGFAETDLHVAGSLRRPRISGGFDLEGATFAGIAVPQALGQFTLAGRRVVLSNTEISVPSGTLYLAGSIPLTVAPLGIGPGDAPLALDASSPGIELADLGPLLPAGSQLRGRFAGHIRVLGDVAEPQLAGTASLTGGAFATPFERVPLSDVSAALAFGGTRAELRDFRASLGSGSLAARGYVDLAVPGEPAGYELDLTAERALVAVPALVNGQLDGHIALRRSGQGPASLSGAVALSDALIPFAALAPGASGAEGAATAGAPQAALATLPFGRDVSFDLDLSAEHDVRVRSANVDVGAAGAVHVGGTSAAPALSGAFETSGGTLTYVNTIFHLQSGGTVTFEPALGMVPKLDIRATTRVLDPDPNVTHNQSGTADVTVAVSGPATNLGVTLASDPTYDRQQILGLLLGVPVMGSNLFTTVGQNGSATPVGLAPGTLVAKNPSGQLVVEQEAFDVANAQFAHALLAPAETVVSDALGLSDINVDLDYTGNARLSARKALAKSLSAVYASSFAYPYRQSFGFAMSAHDSTAAQVTVFTTLGTQTNLTAPFLFYGASSNQRVSAVQPQNGTTGFSLSLQRLYP